MPGLQLIKSDLQLPFDKPEPADPHWEFVSQSIATMVFSLSTILNSFRELEGFYIDN